VESASSALECKQLQWTGWSSVACSTRPARLSTDHDPLFQFHRWQANLRIPDVETVQSVPQVPWSYPFIERLIATIRKYLDVCSEKVPAEVPANTVLKELKSVQKN
jgi:hypothetical protein